MAKSIMEAWPTFSVLVSNNRYCHPADGVFVTNIVLSHAICPSFFAEDAWKSSEIERAYRLHRRWRSAAPLDWAAVTKFKTMKINSEGFL
jgi:hypothetical protein